MSGSIKDEVNKIMDKKAQEANKPKKVEKTVCEDRGYHNWRIDGGQKIGFCNCIDCHNTVRVYEAFNEYFQKMFEILTAKINFSKKYYLVEKTGANPTGEHPVLSSLAVGAKIVLPEDKIPVKWRVIKSISDKDIGEYDWIG